MVHIENPGLNAQRGEIHLRCAHIAHETTRDVVGLGNPIERFLARTGRCNRRGTEVGLR